MRSIVRVEGQSRYSPVIAVLSVIALSTLLRLPLLQWPFADHPEAVCCGHPDEIAQYDLVRSFRDGSDPGSYPPGLAFLTFLALKTPAGAASSAFVSSEVTSGESRDRIRVIGMARILSLTVSGVAVLILYLICIEAGLSPWLAAASAPLLAFAPFYGVQTTYALADSLQLALLLAAVYAFLRWHRRPRLLPEVLVGLFLGGVFAVKIVGIVIALPLLVSMVVRSPSRRRTSLAIAVAFLGGTWAFAGGHMRFASVSSMFQEIVVENTRTSRVRPVWNAIHHLLSLVPGMGVLFVVLLIAAIGWWLTARARARRGAPRSRALDPLPALGIGSLLYFVGICFSSNPFTRHMLPIYPFLILLVLKAADPLLEAMVVPRQRTEAAIFLFSGALAYNAFASWPLLRSFVHDPLDRAAAWVRASTPYEPRVEVFRNFAPVPSVRSRPGAQNEREELLIVHSAWLGRFTGSWWLKPAPRDPRDVYHFDGPFEEVRFWQRLMAGEPAGGRVLASFGDNWQTPERLFLSLIGRGYDQFVTAGRAYVVARTAPPG